MCTQHSHDGEERRCQCCSPEGQRARRCESALRRRGYEGEIDEKYAESTVSERASMADDHEAAAYDGSPTVRRARARAADLTREDQEVLAGDEHGRVRVALAENPATDAQVLDSLAGDDDARVRAGLAANPRTDEATLDALADDERREVREATARHPSTPASALDRMSRHLESRHDLGAVKAICEHPATPARTLERLEAKGSRARRAAARAALKERMARGANAAAGAVLSGADRVGEGMESGLDDVMGLNRTTSGHQGTVKF